MTGDSTVRSELKERNGALTQRGRVLLSLDHKEADRVPIDFGGRHTGLHTYTHRALKQYLGYEGGEENIRNWMLMLADTDPRLLRRFDASVTSVLAQSPDSWQFHVDEETNTWQDEWGVTYYMPPDGYYYDIYRSPLSEADSSEVLAYRYPDPRDQGRVRGLADTVRKLRQENDRAIMICAPTGGVWEHNQWLLGVENAYIQLALNPGLLENLAGRNAEWQAAYWEYVLRDVGDLVDVVQIGDDLGGQNGPLFSPQVFRRLFKPKLKMIVDTIKHYTKARVLLHSCGSVYRLIPDFIDCGVDALNPVQVSAAEMQDTAGLKREFGNDISFWGGGCNNLILATGSPDDVVAEVRQRVDAFAPGGGFIFGSIHNMQANVPPENIVAMYDTAREHGTYQV